MSDVRVVFSKWGGRPHWEYAARRLGEDEHGHWLGAPAGTYLSRPGASVTTEHAFVVLVPARGNHLTTFYDTRRASLTQGWVEAYVDISTRPTWDADTLRLVDLDLDVVKGRTGRVWVDDEDEFADHRVRYGYPADVVDLAVRSCEEVRRVVESGRPPYDGVTAGVWLERVQDVSHER